MLQQFGNAFAFIFVAAIIPVLALTVGRFFRPDYPLSTKKIPYECGELPVGSAYVMFNHRFYLVAIIFLVFDVEVALMFPVMSIFSDYLGQSFGLKILIVSLVFLFTLFLGLVYAWLSGDLEWFMERERDSRVRKKTVTRGEA